MNEGYRIYATSGTYLFLKENRVTATEISKIQEGKHPDAVDLMTKREIDFAVVVPRSHKDSTPKKSKNGNTDGYTMRRMAVDFGIPIFASTDNAAYFVEAVTRYSLPDLAIKSWREYVEQLSTNKGAYAQK
jgi:carbamoyl-phosphate synthase large subunit